MALERQIEVHEGLIIYKPEVIILPTPEQVDRYAGQIIVDQVAAKHDSVLTPATGSSPVGSYAFAIEAHKKGLDFSGVVTRNLDQYWGIDRNHPLSYERFMNEVLFDYINIPESQRHIPNSEAPDPYEEAARYERILQETGTSDLVILGIGPKLTCHIAFNGPGSSLYSRTRVVENDEDTIEANARFCNGDKSQVPQYSITQGVANILEGRKIILIAKGFGKAAGIQRSLEGPVGSNAPASFLRLHPNVTFIIDQEAGVLLEKY